MNLRNVALSALFIASLAAPAIAGGTQTINRHTNRNTRGHSNTKIDVNSYSEGTRVTESQSLKMESWAPRAGASVVFDGSSFKGNSWGTNVPTNPDPIAQGSYTRMTENLSFGEEATVQIRERASFTENMREHNVGSESF